MTAFHLPSHLKAGLERLSHGVSRKSAALRAQGISRAYRSGGNSLTITENEDALAYAMARMPATYAAVAACLEAVRQAVPDFSPQNLLDVGAGPGTATWAAAEAFAGLSSMTMLDRNPPLRQLALDLMQGQFAQAETQYLQGDAVALLKRSAPADLVIASYLIGELDDAQQQALADLMWDKTAGMLVVIEPGTPAGYERLMRLRTALVAKGGHVAAPCPHDEACPLALPDWCHFSQRLPRSRDHKQLKGADLPFEDEKFSYIALTRAPVPARAARILVPPHVSKISVQARLCTPSGLADVTIPRRDKKAYASARKWDWGEAVLAGEADQV